MRAYWKTQPQSLVSHADWRERIATKNRRQGTSAPTLAAAWAGPLELYGGLRQQPHLAELRIDELFVERESPVGSLAE